MRAAAACVLYLTAWLAVGTFFVTCAYFADSAESWSREGRSLPGFIQTYALALPLGFAPHLTAALLMRQLTRVTGLNRFLHWLVFGAALGVALPWAFARVGYLLEGARIPREWQAVKTAVMFPLMGPMMYEVHPIWTLLAVGAATAGAVRLLLAATSPHPLPLEEVR